MGDAGTASGGSAVVVNEAVLILQAHRETLQHVIDCDEMLLFILLSRDVIDQPMFEHLRNERSNWERNRILLDELISQCYATAMLSGARFLACLRDDGQEHVANLINGSKGRELPLTREVRDLIRRVGPLAGAKVNLTESLLDDLERHVVILNRHRQCIDSKPELYRKQIELMQIIPRRSDRAFGKFLEILAAHGNTEARSILRTDPAHIAILHIHRTEEKDSDGIDEVIAETFNCYIVSGRLRGRPNDLIAKQFEKFRRNGWIISGASPTGSVYVFFICSTGKRSYKALLKTEKTGELKNWLEDIINKICDSTKYIFINLNIEENITGSKEDSRRASHKSLTTSHKGLHQIAVPSAKSREKKSRTGIPSIGDEFKINPLRALFSSQSIIPPSSPPEISDLPPTTAFRHPAERSRYSFNPERSENDFHARTTDDLKERESPRGIPSTSNVCVNDSLRFAGAVSQQIKTGVSGDRLVSIPGAYSPVKTRLSRSTSNPEGRKGDVDERHSIYLNLQPYFHPELRNMSQIKDVMSTYIDKPGYFLVRRSFSKLDSFTITLTHQSGIKHINIEIWNSSCFIKTDRCFSSIPELVTYYSTHPIPNLEGIPDVFLLHPIIPDTFYVNASPTVTGAFSRQAVEENPDRDYRHYQNDEIIEGLDGQQMEAEMMESVKTFRKEENNAGARSDQKAADWMKEQRAFKIDAPENASAAGPCAKNSTKKIETSERVAVSAEKFGRRVPAAPVPISFSAPLQMNAEVGSYRADVSSNDAPRNRILKGLAQGQISSNAQPNPQKCLARLTTAQNPAIASSSPSAAENRAANFPLPDVAPQQSTESKRKSPAKPEAASSTPRVFINPSIAQSVEKNIEVTGQSKRLETKSNSVVNLVKRFNSEPPPSDLSPTTEVSALLSTEERRGEPNRYF